MKKLSALSFERNALIAVSIVAVGLAATYFLRAEAITVQNVGTISVTIAPNSGGVGAEFVELNYTGPGQTSLYGWSLHNNEGQIYDLSAVSLENGKSVKICEAGAADPNCVFTWEGNDVFNDAGDSFMLHDRFGSTVVNISYVDSDLSTLISSSGDYYTEVYTRSDKITICHENKGVLQEKSVSANALVGSYEKDNKNSHVNHFADVIPGFIYNFNDGFAYFPGLNWPTQSALLENGCNQL